MDIVPIDNRRECCMCGKRMSLYEYCTYRTLCEKCNNKKTEYGKTCNTRL